MLKAVIDANVFVSALLNPQGKPARVLELVKSKRLKLFISPEILLEIKSVLLYPKLIKRHNRTPKQIDSFIQDYTYEAQIALSKFKYNVIKEDPDDNKYLDCAIEEKVDYIISGDHHLLNLKMFEGVKIVTPAELLELIESTESFTL